MSLSILPRNLIQFWHCVDNIPETIKKAMRNTAANNLNYRVIKADDLFMLDFIKKNYSNCVLELYKQNRIPASRSDLARLLLLYEYGGFYIDASMELQGSLDFLREKKSEIILVRRDDLAIYKNCPNKARLINGFIAAPPKSHFIKWCIDQAFINLLSGYNNNRVNITTGPAVINQADMNFQDLKKTILSFSELNESFIVHRKELGVSNSWVCAQNDGVIMPSFYKNNIHKYRKLYMFKRLSFYFAFGLMTNKK